MIVGLGTDIIETVRIGRVIERHGEQFLHRVFTNGEICYCASGANIFSTTPAAGPPRKP